MIKKTIIRICCLLVCCLSFSQTNLLDTSYWTVGSGSTPGFPMYGIDSENIREMGIGPYGTSVILWKAVPDSLSSDPAGGWHGSSYNIDHTKTYRLTVWVKNTGSLDGRTFFSTSADAQDLEGDPSSLYAGDMPSLGDWYLLVAYIHNSSHVGTNSIGGIYDQTGGKMDNTIDLKFEPSATSMSHNLELYDTTDSTDNQYMYAPTIYEVNGQEPTIQELINAQPNSQNPSGTSGNWSLNNQDVYYNVGNVGIGWDSPDEKLAVNGTIHSKKVKVDLDNWPDYVFAKKHNLPSLEDVEKQIKEKGHLQNIPLAKDVQKNGIFLGEMNAKLLEKIEELTLYTIQQQKRIDSQEEIINKILYKLKISKNKRLNHFIK